MVVEMQGRVLAAKYRLERVLAAGGMGEVWLARHVELHTDVAVKLMSSTLRDDPHASHRFQREARAAARLRCRHVVTVHDFGYDGKTPYLVMERLHGETLNERLARVGRIDAAEADDIVRQTCVALAAAHAERIIHRDIKPSNLFLVLDGPEPLLKVLDFGIAHAFADMETTNIARPSTICGSPAFMSPEQANAESVGPGSDLWSLAVVAYSLLTGKEPFTGRTVSDTLARIRAGRFAPARSIVPELAPALDEFFARAFQLDASERFESGEAFSAAFSSAVGNSRERALGTVTPRHDTTSELVLTTVRAQRSTRIPTLLALVGVAAVLATLTWRGAGARPQRASSHAPQPADSSPAQPTKGAAEKEVATRASFDDAAASPASSSTASATPQARSPRHDRATSVRRDGAPRRSATSSPAVTEIRPVQQHRTTDPLFGLPVTHSDNSDETTSGARSAAPN